MGPATSAARPNPYFMISLYPFEAKTLKLLDIGGVCDTHVLTARNEAVGVNPKVSCTFKQINKHIDITIYICKKTHTHI